MTDDTGKTNEIDDGSFEDLREAFLNLANLMDRRDNTGGGKLRREQFDHIVMLLVQAGLDQEVADEELRNVLRGRESVVLRGMGLTA
ncbi:MAG: hypothetical protein JXQ29_17170 [Planctomycetes bacterium]|nr:hypothetical protein [Planctomycetota bacterium]